VQLKIWAKKGKEGEKLVPPTAGFSSQRKLGEGRPGEATLKMRRASALPKTHGKKAMVSGGGPLWVSPGENTVRY